MGKFGVTSKRPKELSPMALYWIPLVGSSGPDSDAIYELFLALDRHIFELNHRDLLLCKTLLINILTTGFRFHHEELASLPLQAFLNSK